MGQTIKTIAERWRQHLQDARQFDHRPLYRAINKYGANMFTIRPIEEDIPYNQLSEREVHWIEQFDTYNSGYNLTTGGEQNKTIHQEVKDKISSTMSGVLKSEEHTNKMRASHISNNVGFKIRGDGKHHRTKIRGTHINTGEVVEFNSLTEASNKLNIQNSNLSRGIKKGWMVGGYKWEKLENKTINKPIYGKRILDGKIVHHFKSAREAGKVLGTGGTGGVNKAIKNPSRYSWKGCRWYYEDVN